MLRRPTYDKQPLNERPLVERLVESLDRVLRERSEGEPGALESSTHFETKPTAILENDPLEELDSSSFSDFVRAPISDSIESSVPRGTPGESSPALAGITHLEYGGTGPSKAQPLYRHNCKPAPAVTFRTQRRFELLARLENVGIPDSQISSMLCISVPRVRQLKRSKDYLRARIKITHGLILDQDLALEQIKDQRREILREMLPPALQVIANAVLNKPTCFAEAKLQVSVAQDILDREGTFAKISRSEVKPVEHFNWESTDASAAQIVHLMRGSIGTEGTTVRIAEGHSAKLIEISKAFTAGSNISPEEAIASAKMLEDAAPPEGWAPDPALAGKTPLGQLRNGKA